MRGGGLPFPIPMGGKGGGGLGLILLVAVLFFLGRGLIGGGDGSNGISPIDLPDAAAPSAGGSVPEGDTAAEFVAAVSKDTQDFWQGQFTKAGKDYPRAKVVLFTSGTQSGCGPASSATGPFYCPLDRRVYLDLGFFRQLASRFGAPGDFAQAYVIAHELGHHVQTVLGIEPEVRQLQQDEPDRANELSVRMELQADCLAGVWGHSVYVNGRTGQGNVGLEDGDVEEGIAAAEAVGDDRLGARSPESWTHGSSALRVKWFRTGFDAGDANSCDTFSGDL
jgi:predicted metalloprotease